MYVKTKTDTYPHHDWDQFIVTRTISGMPKDKHDENMLAMREVIFMWDNNSWSSCLADDEYDA